MLDSVSAGMREMPAPTRFREPQPESGGPAPDSRRQVTNVTNQPRLRERRRDAIRSAKSSSILLVQVMSRPRDRPALPVTEGGLSSAP